MLDDIGVAERFLHGGVRNDGYIFNFKGSDVKPELDYTRLPTRYPFVCMFNQNETEKILRDHLENNLSLPIEWNADSHRYRGKCRWQGDGDDYPRCG